MTPQEKLAQQIQVLEALAAIDRSLGQLGAHIKDGQGTIDTLRQELTFLDTKLATDQTSLNEMQHTAGDLSTEARQMSVQIEKSRDKLGRARNDREAMNAEREQEELVGMQRDFIEAARKSVADPQAKRDKVHRELTASEGSTSAGLQEARQEHEAKLAERTEIAKKLPAPLLKRYEMVHKKKASALARTTDGTCQACHVALPPQFFQKLLRRESLEECPMCHRILYYWAEAKP